MAEHSGRQNEGRVRIRVVGSSSPAGLEVKVNQVLDEELVDGTEVVDIKLASTAEGADKVRAEHVALIHLRSSESSEPGIA